MGAAAKKQNGAKSSLGGNGLRLLAGESAWRGIRKRCGPRKRRREGGGAESGRQRWPSCARADFRDLADV